MAIDFGAFSSYFRLPARVYGAIALVSAALLFLPVERLKLLGLDVFAHDHRAWIGFVFLLAVALLLVEVGNLVWKYLRGKAKGAAERSAAQQAAEAKARDEEATRTHNLENLIARLGMLTRDEKDVLSPYVLLNMRSQKLRANSATVHALIGSAVLARPGQLTDYDYELGDYAADVFIQPWALQHLTSHPELLR